MERQNRDVLEEDIDQAGRKPRHTGRENIMVRKTETQKLQEYADAIWGVGKMKVQFIRFVGFEMIDAEDIRMGRIIGRDASEAHAELDAMADLAKAQAQQENAIRGL